MSMRFDEHQEWEEGQAKEKGLRDRWREIKTRQLRPKRKAPSKLLGPRLVDTEKKDWLEDQADPI